MFSSPSMSFKIFLFSGFHLLPSLFYHLNEEWGKAHLLSQTIILWCPAGNHGVKIKRWRIKWVRREWQFSPTNGRKWWHKKFEEVIWRFPRARALCYRNLEIHIIVFFRWMRPLCQVCHAKQLQICCARRKAPFNSRSVEAWLCTGLFQATRATELPLQTQQQSLVSSHIHSSYDRSGIMCCLNSTLVLAKQVNFTVSPVS